MVLTERGEKRGTDKHTYIHCSLFSLDLLSPIVDSLSATMAQWKNKHTYLILAAAASIHIFRPFKCNNVYTIFSSIIGGLFSFIPRHMYRKFHWKKENKTVLNYIMVLFTILLDIPVCNIFLITPVAALMPEAVLSVSDSLGHQTTCAIYSLIDNTVTLCLLNCINAMNLSRLSVIFGTYRFIVLDETVHAAVAYVGIIGVAVITSLTGYRLYAQDYCDPILMNVVYRQVGVNITMTPQNNYPEFPVYYGLTVVTHIICSIIVYKKSVVDSIRNNRVVENRGAVWNGLGLAVLNLPMIIPEREKSQRKDVYNYLVYPFQRIPFFCKIIISILIS